MAIPAMTANSPSAGYIAWGAFNIQYSGVSYAVAAGSTNKRWVWWKYNAGAPTITAGDDLPVDAAGNSTLTDDDIVLFGNKNGVPVRVQAATLVDGELLVNGSILTDALAADFLTADHLMAGDALIEGVGRITHVISQVVETSGLKIGNSTWSTETGFEIPGVIYLPVDGSTAAEVDAAMNAQRLTIEDYFSLRGQVNSVEAGARVLLNQGVTAPKAAPGVTSWWPSMSPLVPWYDGASFAGLNMVNSATREIVTSQSTGLGGYLQRYVGGTRTAEIALGGMIVDSIEWKADGTSLGLGAATDPGYYYVLGHDWYTGEYQVKKVAADFSSVVATYVIGPKTKFVKKPIINFFNDTYMQIIGWTTSTTLVRELRAWTTPQTLYTTYAFNNEGSAFDLAGAVSWAPTSAGANFNYRTIWGRTVNPLVFDGTTLNKYTYPSGTPAFVRPYGREVVGVDSGFVMDSQGVVYTVMSKQGAGEVAYSFADVDTAGTGQHETALSPVASLGLVSLGAAWRISVAPPPYDGTVDSPNQAPVYARTDAAQQFRYQGYPDLSKLSFDFTTINTDGTIHGGLAGFDAVGLSPAYLASAASDGFGPINHVSGDGSGRMGPYRWDKNGVPLLRTDDTGWQALTLLNSWTNWGGTWPGPAYRRIGNRVHLRGLIKSPATVTAGVSMFTLPVGARPAVDEMHVCLVSSINEATGALSKTTSGASAGTAHTHTVGMGSVPVPINNTAGRIELMANGSALFQQATMAGAAWLSLTQVEFFTD